jgi:hypothetical protein
MPKKRGLDNAKIECRVVCNQKPVEEGRDLLPDLGESGRIMNHFLRDAVNENVAIIKVCLGVDEVFLLKCHQTVLHMHEADGAK